MKDTEINATFGIPISTLQHWKKSGEGNWRRKLYLHLKNPNEDLKDENKNTDDLLKRLSDFLKEEEIENSKQ